LTIHLLQQSADTFAAAKVPVAQVRAMQTLSGVYARGGDTASAQKILTSASAVFDANHLFPVSLGGSLARASAVSPATDGHGGGETGQLTSGAEQALLAEHTTES